jgi:hypothetical protein
MRWREAVRNEQLVSAAGHVAALLRLPGPARCVASVSSRCTNLHAHALTEAGIVCCGGLAGLRLNG